MKPRINILLLFITAALFVSVSASLVFSDGVAVTLPGEAASSPAGAEVVAPQADSSNINTFQFDELDLREAPLRDALALIGESAGVNLAASNDAAKITVSIHLRGVTAYQAVQALCETNGLYYRKTTGNEVGIVTTLKEFQEGLTVFREENTRVFTLL
jgi:hypothetical protein